MAVNRRSFLKQTLRALIAAPIVWAAERVVPMRYTEALRARFYPGSVKPIDPAKLRQPGKWAG